MNFSKFKTSEILTLPVEAPIKETYEFVTDIIETFNGTEERHKMRGVPKQTFNYTLVADKSNSQEFLTQLQGNIRRDWAIPIWTEIQKINEVKEGDLSLVVDEFALDFVVGNSVYIYNFCSSGWLAFDIVKRVGNEIFLNEPFPKGMKNFYALPLKRAWIKGSVSKDTNGISSKPQATFVMYDVSNVPGNEFEVFNKHPLLNLPTMLNSGSTSRTVTMRQDLADFDTGVVEWRTTWKKSRYVTDMSVLMTSAKDVFKTKQLLFTQGGKHLSFWLPTYESVVSVVNIVGSELICKKGNIELNEIPFNLCLHHANSITPVTIVDFEDFGENFVKLVASKNIDVDFSSLNLVSYLKLNRFDSDSFSFEHLAGVEKRLTTTISETNS